MKLTILISTVDSRVLINSKLIDFISTEDRIEFVVVNQIINNTNKLKLNLKNCKIVNTKSQGLSKSRNIALQQINDGIAIFADDDVFYTENLYDKIISIFKENKEYDLVTFKISSPEGLSYKKYKEENFTHNFTSLLKVSSISIAIDVENIKRTNVCFDERFGLGAKFKTGEENIFLTDLFKKNVKMKFVNEFLVYHPLESSGNILDLNQFTHKGALFYRIFGIYGAIAFLFFCVKKKFVEKRVKKISLAHMFVAGYNGFKELIKNN